MRRFILSIAGALVVTMSAAAEAKISITADAGSNQIVSEGALVTLNGAGSKTSDAGGVSFQWVQMGGPDIDLNNDRAASPQFKVPAMTNNRPLYYAFKLFARNKSGEEDSDNVYVIAFHQNKPPVAVVSGEQAVGVGEIIFLSGANSTDAEGDPLEYLWTQEAGPSLTISHSRIPEIFFIAPPAPEGSYPYRLVFNLSVRDDNSAWQSASTKVLVHGDADAVDVALGLKGSAPEKTPLLRQMEDARATRKNIRIRDFSEAEMTAARDLYNKGAYNECLRRLEKVLMITPDHNEAAELFKKADEKRRLPFKLKWDQAKDRFLKEDYLAAVRLLQGMRTEGSDRVEVQALIEISIQALEQMVNNWFDTCISRTASLPEGRKDSDKSRTYYNQGLQLYAQGRLKEAAAMWKKAAAFDQTNKLALSAYNRVVVEIEQNP